MRLRVMGAGIFVSCRHLLFLVFLIDPASLQTDNSFRIVYLGYSNYYESGLKVWLGCTDASGGVPSGHVQFRRNGTIIEPNSTLVNVVRTGIDYIEFIFNRSQEGYFSCFNDTGEESNEIGLAAGYTLSEIDRSLYYRFVVLTINTARTVELNCPFRPGILQQHYSVQWYRSYPAEALSYNTFDIRLQLEPIPQFNNDYVFSCDVTVNFTDAGRSGRIGRDTFTIVSVRELPTLGNDIQNRTISGREVDTYFVCDIISSENSAFYNVFWTVGVERFDCTENTLQESNRCLVHESGNYTSLLIEDVTQLDVGVLPVTCNIHHNLSQQFLDDPSYLADYDVVTRGAYLTIEPVIMVEYPYPVSRSFALLLCVIGGSTPISGALFYKEGHILTSGSGRNQVTLLANAGDGTVEFIFKQDQEGLFSCGKNGLKSIPIGLATSPDEHHNGTTKNRYILFPPLHTSRTIQLSCDIRPGALSERYSVEWLVFESESSSFTLIPNQTAFDITITALLLVSKQQYVCRVTIEHVPGNTSLYNGPTIIIHNQKLVGIAESVLDVEISQGDSVEMKCQLSNNETNVSIYWVLDEVEYNCRASSEIELIDNGCYSSGLISYLLLRDTKSLSVGYHPVQCIVQQNLSSLFVNDPSFDDSFDSVGQNGTITVRQEIPVLLIAEVVSISSVSLVFLVGSVVLIGLVYRARKEIRLNSFLHRNQPEIALSQVTSAYKKKPPRIKLLHKRPIKRDGTVDQLSQEAEDDTEDLIDRSQEPEEEESMCIESAPAEEVEPISTSEVAMEPAITPPETSCLPDHMTHVSELTCTSTGLRFVDDNNDFILEIPEGAVPESVTLNIDVGVALCGPFLFPEGLRPVSAVFWICVRHQPDFIFSKPVTLTIPHFIKLENEGDIQSLGLTFLSARHNPNSANLYEFQQTEGQMEFDPSKKAGILITTHFCSLCIGCYESPELYEKAEYYCTPCLPGRAMVNRKQIGYFFITFSNPTCLTKVRQIIKKKQLHYKEVEPDEFYFKRSRRLKIEITLPKHGDIGYMGNRKILQSRVDFSKMSKEELQEREEEGTYPPRFKIYFVSTVKEPTLSGGKITIGGTMEDLIYSINLQEEGRVPPPEQEQCPSSRKPTDELGCISPWDETHNEMFETHIEMIKKPRLIIFDISDLYEVSTHCINGGVMSKWKFIGLALGLQEDQLEEIEKNQRWDTRDRLNEMLKNWLNQAYNTGVHKKPSLLRLGEAIKDPAGARNPAAAQKICPIIDIII